MPAVNLAILILFIAASAFMPGSKSFFSRRWLRAALLAILSLPVAYSFLRVGIPDVFTFDDSYISLAAARNVVEHFELAVVRGRALQGVTSPLHVLIVGLIGTLTGVELAARIVSLVAFLAAVIGTAFYAEKLTEDPRGFVIGGALCVFSGPMLYDIGNGMETSLFTALLVWLFYSARFAEWDRRGIIARGVLAGCAMLTRPEGSFAAVIVFGFPAVAALIRRDLEKLRKVVVAGAVVGLVYLPFLAANLYYTGHFLSATVSAKCVYFRHGEMQFPSLSDLGHPLTLFLLSADFLGAAALIGLAIARRFEEISFVIAFYCAYLIRFPDALNHYRTRYQHPLWPLLAIGAACLALFIAKRFSKIRLVPNLVLGVLAAAAIFPTIQSATIFKGAYKTDTTMIRDTLLQTVTAVKARTQPNDLVAAHDVGVLIYYGGRNVLDLVGLTDEKIARRLAEKKDKVTDAIKVLVHVKKPKVLVVLRDWEAEHLHITWGAPPGRFNLAWSSPVNISTLAIYDVYDCRWATHSDTITSDK